MWQERVSRGIKKLFTLDRVVESQKREVSITVEVMMRLL